MTASQIATIIIGVIFAWASLVQWSHAAATPAVTEGTYLAEVTPYRYALVIGNRDYSQSEHGLEDVPPALDDEQSIVDRLVSHAVDVVAVRNASHNRIIAEVANLATRAQRATRGNQLPTVVFYFSGHGMSVRGQDYIVGIDADDSMPVHKSYAVSEIIRTLSSKANAIILLDACRTNVTPIESAASSPTPRGSARSATDSAQSARYRLARSACRSRLKISVVARSSTSRIQTPPTSTWRRSKTRSTGRTPVLPIPLRGPNWQTQER